MPPAGEVRRVARWDWRDWLLAGTLGPFWAICVALSMWDGLANPQGFPGVAAAQDASAAGLVVAHVMAEDTPIRPGDRLLSLGEADLRGVSYFEFTKRFHHVRLTDPGAQLVYERGGQIFSAPLPLTSPIVIWWVGLLFSTAMTTAAFLALLRAHGWHLRRRFFAGAMPWAILSATGFLTAGGLFTQVGIPIRSGGMAIGITLALRNSFEWTEAARPLRAWQRALPWLLGAGYILGTVQRLWNPAQAVVGPSTSWFVLVFCVATLYAFARASRRSDAGEQRRIRWVIYGFAVSMVVLFMASIVQLLNLSGEVVSLFTNSASLAGIAVPAGFLVSILFYDYLDVDRLITGTAAAAALLLVLGAAAFAAVPPVADAIGAATAVDPRTAQLVLSMGLAALLVPGYQILSRRFDAWLFPQREALEQGFDELLDTLSRCSGAQELTRTAGESIDRLLQPESIATYAREGEAFTPVFVRGRAVPPAFEANSPLITALQSRTTPLVADRLVRGEDAGLSPFDRAALETLDVATIGPTHRRGTLVAFQCLGPKKSGDIYTPTDMALLSAVSSKVADLLDRFDDEAVLNEAREMQSALRRYVPGAVADELARGEDLPSGEREVTVFFVDIRGYTSLAEGLAPDEIFSTVNRHTENVSTVVSQHGGCVVEFNGDGMMAVFGAPQALSDKEACAVAAAREVLAALERSDITVGIGIATGPAFVGDIQSADRRIWSVIGNTTNLAARLQGLTRQLNASIAVDADTRSAAGAACRGFLIHADVRIRGRTDPMDLFALPLPDEDAATPKLSAVS